MSIDAKARTHLLANEEVAALVAPASIVGGGDLPQEAPYPAVVILSETYPEPTMSGTSTITRSILRITALAADTDTENGLVIAKKVADAVVKALHYFRGDWSGTPVRGVFLEQREDVEPEPDSEICGVAMDFTVWHRPVP